MLYTKLPSEQGAGRAQTPGQQLHSCCVSVSEPRAGRLCSTSVSLCSGHEIDREWSSVFVVIVCPGLPEGNQVWSWSDWCLSLSSITSLVCTPVNHLNLSKIHASLYNGFYQFRMCTTDKKIQVNNEGKEFKRCSFSVVQASRDRH